MTLIQASLERLESSGHRTDGFLEAYSEPHRVYHNLDHIHDVLLSITEMSNLFKFPRRVGVAADRRAMNAYLRSTVNVYRRVRL